MRHEEAVGRRLDEILDDGFFEVLRSARRESPDGAAHLSCPARRLGTQHRGALLVNVGDDSAPRLAAGAIAGTIRDHRGHFRARAAGGTAADFGEDGVNRSPRGRRCARGQHAADRHLELRADAAGGAEPDDPSTTRVLEKIERQTFRAAQIVNGLLNLARPAQVDSGPIDVNVVVNDVLSLPRAPDADRSHPGAQGARRDAGPSCQGIEYKLQQVFLNLFLNARDAMPKGGWLTIVTRAERADATIEVADTGSGIPAEQLSRIYDPFFTTKEIGKGRDSGCRLPTESCRSTVARLPVTARPDRAPRFTPVAAVGGRPA